MHSNFVPKFKGQIIYLVSFLGINDFPDGRTIPVQAFDTKEKADEYVAKMHILDSDRIYDITPIYLNAINLVK